METLQKPMLIRQVACSPHEEALLDHLILEHLRQSFFQGQRKRKSDWIQYARLREPDRTRNRVEFS